MSNEINEISTAVHQFFMKQALREAQKAFDEDEVPIGCIVVAGDKIIGRGYNQTERLKDATAHAEMIAITAATNYLGNKLLEGCRVYITVEPCTMCAGALFWTRPDMVIYGASEPKVGFTCNGNPVLHARTQLLGGIMDEDAASLMKSFFKKKRLINKT